MKKQIRALSYTTKGLVYCLLAVFFLYAAFPSVAAPTKQNTLLVTLEKEFDALCKDKTKGALRHNWLQLESRFDAAADKQSQKGKALFMAARCREELSSRSYSPADYKEATTKYRKMAARWPKNALAPEALSRAESIARNKLNDAKTADAILADLRKKYPNSSKSETQISPKGASAQQAAPAKTKKDATPSPRESKTKKPIADQLGLSIKTVLIDAGHGGKDPGAEGNGIRESLVTLKVAKMVGDMLKKEGITVLYTRTADKFIALQDRTTRANNSATDLFISIHVNANNDPAINGLETYYLSSATNTAAAKVAARENSISVSEVSDLQFILTDLMLNAKTQESKNLARLVHNGMLGRVKQSGRKMADHGVRTAPFYVLMGARMPAVLVEIGYLTNKSDAANLKNQAYLTNIAQGIAQGVIAYKAQVAKGIK